MYRSRRFNRGRRNVQGRHRREDDALSMFEESMSCFRNLVTEPDPSNTEILQVVSVDKNIKENTKAHHTDEFDITDASNNNGQEFLVVRRGQAFDLTLKFNRPYDTKKDELRFVFTIGKNPIVSKGTHVQFILSAKDEPKKWGGYIVYNKGNTLRVTLVTPPSCFVGKWQLKIDVVKKKDTEVQIYRWHQKKPIYVLFNPWNKDDQVHMNDENLLKEYVLNETGRIYAGNSKLISPKPWCFGQFTEDLLDCCMYILEISNLKDVNRGDPVLVSRALSAVVNSPGESGVLAGNWSGEYDDGVSPLKWTGSVEILKQYFRTKEPVLYGQCWVFSGVLTTVCRALGIPCRSVTNFASAHDTNKSVTIDLYFDKEGNPVDSLNSDSVWNFHVWNDVWMARPELPAGYGGWQALDATPQETSDGEFQMGPASVNAIKRGDIFLPYDTAFAFAEVNADKVYWKEQKDASFKPVFKKKYGIGRFISTKQAGTDDRDDVTNLYKYPDGSAEERAAVMQAHLHSDHALFDAYEQGSEDVSFELTAQDNRFMGEPIDVELKIKNNSKEKRIVQGTLAIASVFYTGVSKTTIESKKLYVTLEAGQEKVESIHIEECEYTQALVDHCMFKMSCMCYIEKTKQVFTDVEELRLRKPHLTVKAPSTAKVGEEFEVNVSFVNPLQESLTGAELRVDCPGFEKRPPMQLRKDVVQPKQTFVKSFRMMPVKPGNREIIVYYNCKQIESVNVSHGINIRA